MKRRDFLGAALTAALFPPSTTEIKPGDILLTRNAGGEEFNKTPGYYNHASMFINLNWVMEAQRIPDSVIVVPVWNFFERYPEILVLRNINSQAAQRTADIAPRYIGRSYASYISIRPLYLWNNQDNCVSLIRRIYNAVTGYDYKWRIPDDFTKFKWLEKAALKKDYENHIEVEDDFIGMQKIWTGKQAEKVFN